MGRRKKVILGLILCGLFVLIYHLFSTQERACYYNSLDEQYDVCYAEYNFSEYFLTEPLDQKGKIVVYDKIQNKEIHTSHFHHYNDLEGAEFSTDSVYIIGKIAKQYKLPRKIDIEYIDHKYRLKIPLVDRIKDTYDFNNDGLLDKYALAYEDGAKYVVIYLKNTNEGYREIRSGYIDNAETLLQDFKLINNGQLEMYFSEEVRSMRWNRVVRLSYNSVTDGFNIIYDTTHFESIKYGNFNISIGEDAIETLGINYHFPAPKKLVNIRYDHYNYTFENADEYPMEYIETLSFLDSIDHDTSLDLKPMEYNLSKFVDYHGSYHRELEAGGSVSVTEDGTLELEDILELTINGNNGILVNNSTHFAIVYMNNSHSININNLTMYHDVLEYTCSAPVVRAQRTSALLLESVTLDGSGEVGLEFFQSNGVLRNSKIKNCSGSVLDVMEDSNLKITHTIIEKNYAYQLFEVEYSEVSFSNCIIRHNIVNDFYDFESSKIKMDSTRIYENFSVKEVTSKNTEYLFTNSESYDNHYNLFNDLDDTLLFYAQLKAANRYPSRVTSVYNLKKQLDAKAINKATVAKYSAIVHDLKRLKAYEGGIFLTQEILNKFPNRTESLIHLGDMYWETNEREKAKSIYNQYYSHTKANGVDGEIPQHVLDRLKWVITSR